MSGPGLSTRSRQAVHRRVPPAVMASAPLALAQFARGTRNHALLRHSAIAFSVRIGADNVIVLAACAKPAVLLSEIPLWQ
jgi:hypothetical protein